MLDLYDCIECFSGYLLYSMPNSLFEAIKKQTFSRNLVCELETNGLLAESLSFVHPLTLLFLCNVSCSAVYNLVAISNVMCLWLYATQEQLLPNRFLLNIRKCEIVSEFRKSF